MLKQSYVYLSQKSLWTVFFFLFFGCDMWDKFAASYLMVPGSRWFTHSKSGSSKMLFKRYEMITDRKFRQDCYVANYLFELSAPTVSIFWAWEKENHYTQILEETISYCYGPQSSSYISIFHILHHRLKFVDLVLCEAVLNDCEWIFRAVNGTHEKGFFLKDLWGNAKKRLHPAATSLELLRMTNSNQSTSCIQFIFFNFY